MENNIKRYVQNNAGYTLRHETYDNTDYLVAPVIMMVEGVHNGSHGPLYHAAEELGKYPASWNGIPVTVQHPSIDGLDVSANEPKVLEQFAVGQVFNASIDDGKLRGEAWIKQDKLKKLSKEALEYIEEQRPLDVSIGVFTDEEQKEGNYNGETYQAIARNHRPDHLALLPGGQGACSWADGCGIRLNNSNNKGGSKMSDEKKTCCPDKVDALIANELTRFTKDDKEWLLTQSEDTIEKLLPVEKKAPDNNVKAPTKAEAINVLKETVKNPNEFMQILPKEIAAQMQHGLKLHQDHRKAMTDLIINNTAEGTWTEDELKEMTTPVLEKIANSVKKEETQDVHDYSLMGSGTPEPQNNEGVLMPAGFGKKQEK